MKWFWWLAAPLPLAAHMVSMSTGELKVDGSRAHYELRIPAYEVAHVHEPEHTLLDHIRFKSGGAWGTPSAETCKDEQGTYVCTADYALPASWNSRLGSCVPPEGSLPSCFWRAWYWPRAAGGSW